MRMRRPCWVFFRRNGTVRIQGQATQPDQVWQLLWKVKEQWQMEANDFVRLWQMMVLIWFPRQQQLNSWESSCLWCRSHFFLGLPTRSLISSLLIWCLKAWTLGNGAERSLRLESLPTLGNHTEMCMSMMRWQGYCKWSMGHLGNKSTGPIAKDWHSFLCACKAVEDSGWKAKELLRRDFGAETAGWLKLSSCSSHRQGTLWAGCSLDSGQQVGTICTLCICLRSFGGVNKLPKTGWATVLQFYTYGTDGYR